jgi:hypothetical protein
MKQASSRDVFNYWNERRGVRPAPDRSEIEPGAIRRALGDTFILAFDPGAEHPFRLAGTRVCALFCRELKNQAFVDLWEDIQRAPMRELIAIVAEESVGIVAGASSVGPRSEALDLELLLLPLSYRSGKHARLLGVLAPTTVPHWLGASPLTNLRLGPLRHLGPAVETVAAPSLVSMRPPADARKGFIVHDGGRS